jgi:hypothetical protein
MGERYLKPTRLNLQRRAEPSAERSVVELSDEFV